jgi:4'-phosphopantetheinyl transferase EntD
LKNASAKNVGGSLATVLLDLLHNLLPHGVVVAGGSIGSPDNSSFEIEERALGRALPKRKREFRAGRAYARAALSLLGIEPCGIPVGEQRQPVWPPGIVGSITHTDTLSFAIAAHAADFRVLGIDVEPNTALDPDLIALVCRPEEREGGGESGKSGVDKAKLFFVIKEAFFKAYFPATGSFLEFEDVLATIDMHEQSFHAELAEPSKPSLSGRRALRGRFGLGCGHLVAIVAMPA